jgi:signal transduction histidine kinase
LLEKILKIEAHSERSFLHDLAAPLMIAHGNGSRLLESSQQQLSSSQVEQLQKMLRSIERMIELVRERRQSLHDT